MGQGERTPPPVSFAAPLGFCTATAGRLIYPLHPCIPLLLSVPISSNENKCREGVHIIAAGFSIPAYSLNPPQASGVCLPLSGDKVRNGFGWLDAAHQFLCPVSSFV